MGSEQPVLWSKCPVLTVRTPDTSRKHGAYRQDGQLSDEEKKAKDIKQSSALGTERIRQVSSTTEV